MGYVVSFENYMPTPRHDGVPWSKARIEESVGHDGPWTTIETIVFSAPDLDVNPAMPKSRSFTTDNATIEEGWYRVTFLDATNATALPTSPVHNSTTEILASLDDINANLDGSVVKADWQNTALLQISVARVVRAYLSRAIDNLTLFGWATPDTTPQIIREIAAKLIAAQLYLNKISKQSLELPDRHFAQRLYDSAIAMLEQIIGGEILIEGVTIADTESMTIDDFFPVDATDRAFSLSKRFYGQTA